jgi:hypothetical protein
MGTLDEANKTTATMVNTQMSLLNLKDQEIVGTQTLVALG